MDDSEIKYYVVGTGSWRDLLPKLPRPVFAFGENDIYWVMVKGTGFTLPIDDSCVDSFFTGRFVSASTVRDAKRIAFALVGKEWEQKGYKERGGSVSLTVNDIDVLRERFRLRSGTGFTFYTMSDGDQDTTV